MFWVAKVKLLLTSKSGLQYMFFQVLSKWPLLGYRESLSYLFNFILMCYLTKLLLVVFDVGMSCGYLDFCFTIHLFLVHIFFNYFFVFARCHRLQSYHQWNLLQLTFLRVPSATPRSLSEYRSRLIPNVFTYV